MILLFLLELKENFKRIKFANKGILRELNLICRNDTKAKFSI